MSLLGKRDTIGYKERSVSPFVENLPFSTLYLSVHSGILLKDGNGNTIYSEKSYVPDAMIIVKVQMPSIKANT